MAPGLGYTEIAFVILLAVLLIKPKDLPAVMRSVARFWRDASRFLWGVRDSLKRELDDIRDMEEVRDLKSLTGMKDLAGLEGPDGLRSALKDPLGLAALEAERKGSPKGAPFEPEPPVPMEEIYPELRKASQDKDSAGAPEVAGPAAVADSGTGPEAGNDADGADVDDGGGAAEPGTGNAGAVASDAGGEAVSSGGRGSDA
jgi:Sec-independent protein translocase protein TatA